ncbi:MAG: hypothetical protein Q9169_002233 [Polycauliona sp. 2 TL-2023]
MLFPNVSGIIAALILLFSLSTAVPHTQSRTLHQLSSRQEAADSEGQPCWYSNKCRGIWADGPACNQTNIQQGIDDISLLTHAALNALYTNASRSASPTDLPTGALSPADHFFYFFENNMRVAEFVANVFKNITVCADKHDCPYKHVVFCDLEAGAGSQYHSGACDTPAGRYAYVMNPNQYSGPQSTINGVVARKGGSIAYSCPVGRELPRMKRPCSSEEPAEPIDSMGSALLAQFVQSDMMTQYDMKYLEQKTGWQNITVQNENPNARAETSLPTSPAQGMTLMEMGFGVNGNGLRQRGLANAENYVEFAKWSYYMNYGTAPAGVTNQKCNERFERVIARDGASPITG